MRHEARLPDDSVNVSGTHPVREAFVLVGGLSAVFAIMVALAAASVDLMVRFVPPSVEARAFAGWDPVAPGDASAAGADADLEHAQALVDRLASHWPDAPYRFRVLLYPGPEANAAALPGGRILLTRGLLDQTRTENELAFVLGHELGHFAHRDHLRRLGRMMLFSLALTPLLASGHAVPEMPGLIAEVTARGFDRSQESGADRFGLALVHDEYGHVAAAGDFLERLSDGTTPLGRLAAYASTHPVSPARVAELRHEALRRHWQLTGPTTPF